MFTFLVAIFSAKWISDHMTEIILCAVLIILLIIYAVHKKKKAMRQYAAAQQARIDEEQRNAELQKIEEERQAAIATHRKPFPEDIEGLQIEYAYRDVVIIPEGLRMDIEKGEKLDFMISDDQITITFNNTPIGHMRENRLTGMIRDWNAKEDPYRAYFIENTDSGPMIALFFYSDVIGKFLQRNRDAKLIKLTGKQDDLAFYEIGNRCEIEQDIDDPDKYNVTYDDAIIGRLPSAGVSYAEKHGCSPEDLTVIIAEIDYDIDKERDIISVYISD